MATGGHTPLRDSSNNNVRNSRPSQLLSSRFNDILHTAERFLECVNYLNIDANTEVNMDTHFLSPYAQNSDSTGAAESTLFPFSGQGNRLRGSVPFLQNFTNVLAEIPPCSVDRFSENISHIQRQPPRSRTRLSAGVHSVSNTSATTNSPKLCPETTTNSDKTRQEIITCPICMGPSLSREPTATKCGHVFCGPCIYKAIRLTQKCPVCNTKTIARYLLRLYL